MTVDVLAPSEGATEATLAISEVSERTGITEHTLRYYERIGLLAVDRDTGGRRRYTEHDLGRVIFIGRLRMSEMPIREIQRYIELVHAGPSSEPQRLALLEEHRSRVIARRGELDEALSVIDYKIAVYGGSLGTCTP